MRVRLILLGALVLATATPSVAQDWKAGSEIRIGTEGAYKPWNFRQRDGKLAGFEIDLVKLLCSDIGFKCTFQTTRWARMLPSLERGDFDAIFAGMSITAARKSKALFTEPYATTPAVFVAAPGGKLPNTKTQAITLPKLNPSEQTALVAIRKAFLNGAIGVQKGTTHERFLQEYIEGYAETRTYENQRQLDKDVASGRLAAMLVGLGYAMPLVRRAKNRSLMIVGPRLSGGLFGEGIGAAVRRGDQGLARIFSGAIKKRISDGSIRALSIKWFGFDLSARP